MGYSPKGSPKETSQRGSLRRHATPGRHSRRSSSGMLFRQPSYQPPPNEEARHIFEKRVERWRCYAYLFFWSLIFLAKFMTKHYVVEMLAAGVDKMTVPKERWGCGPFNRGDSLFNITYGDGFDFHTQSHLWELFGFPNICTEWDYSPSREITAMWFPLFEYSIVAYLLLDITNTTLSYKRGEIPLWFNRLSIIICWVTIFLAIQFRMIFVCIAYDNPRGHTLGFLGLQVALLLIAFQNAFYVVITGQSYPPYLTAKRTQMVGQAYLAGLTAVGVVKVAGTVHIVTHGVGPDWYKIEFLHGMVFGKCVDIVWMVFNAVIPFFIAAVRAAHEQPLKIEISCSNPEYRYSQTDPNGWIDEDTELMPMNEGTRLLTKREQDWVAMQS